MLRALKFFFLAATVIFFQLAATAQVMAQEAEVEDTSKSYILGYVLAMFVVALGVFAICRPSGREDRPKMAEVELEDKLKLMSGKD